MKRRLAVVATGGLYLAAFGWSYASLIAPLWGYSGLVDRAVPDGSLLVAYALAWLPLWALPIRLERPSDVVAWILYLFAYAPGSVMPYYVLGLGFAALPVSLALSAGFGLLLIMRRVPRVLVPSMLGPQAWYPLILLLGGAAASAFVGLTLGFRFELPSFADVYDVRAEYSAQIQSTSRLAAYALSWSTAAIGPALIALGLQRRQIIYLLAGGAMQLIAYGLTGSKVALLSSLLLVLLLYVLSPRRRRVGGLVIVGSATSMVVALGALQWTTGDGTLSSLLVRRLIAVPGRLFALYTDFFSSNPTYGLSHSVLSSFVDRPYDIDPDGLIAYTYDGRIYGANAGFWADGMANFGIAGVLGFSLLLGILLWGMDSLSAGRPLASAGAVLGVASFSLVNSGLLTSLLTHGIGAAILLVWLMPSEPDSSAPVPDALSPVLGKLGHPSYG